MLHLFKLNINKNTLIRRDVNVMAMGKYTTNAATSNGMKMHKEK